MSVIKSANTVVKSREANGYSGFSRSETGAANFKCNYKL